MNGRQSSDAAEKASRSFRCNLNPTYLGLRYEGYADGTRQVANVRHLDLLGVHTPPRATTPLASSTATYSTPCLTFLMPSFNQSNMDTASPFRKRDTMWIDPITLPSLYGFPAGNLASRPAKAAPKEFRDACIRIGKVKAYAEESFLYTCRREIDAMKAA
jgi:hypothetical protein